MAIAFSLLAVAPAAATPACPVSRAEFTVNGDSMSELFPHGQTVQAESGYYACHEPARGEVALVQPGGFKRPLLKVIQVMPGDRFALRCGQGAASRCALLVNGQPLLTPRGREYRFRGQPVRMIHLYEKQFGGTMPADTFFVFGTQPDGSRDSTRFGPVPRDALKARVPR